MVGGQVRQVVLMRKCSIRYTPVGAVADSTCVATRAGRCVSAISPRCFSPYSAEPHRRTTHVHSPNSKLRRLLQHCASGAVLPRLGELTPAAKLCTLSCDPGILFFPLRRSRSAPATTRARHACYATQQHHGQHILRVTVNAEVQHILSCCT